MTTQPTDDEMKPLADAIAEMELSGEQLDRLTDSWIEANSADRITIGKLFSRQFSDPTFVQRIIPRLAARKEDLTRRQTPKPTQILMQRELRQELETSVCRFNGAGPFALAFGQATTEAEVTEIQLLLSNQFRQPTLAEIKRMVTLPKSLSTRTRRNVYGNYTWFIRAKATNEIACAVACNIHQIGSSGNGFIEVPLFATHFGYRRLGLARLLNAALQQHCGEIGATFVLISADAAAVPFWCHIGYRPLPSEEYRSLEHHIKERCQMFDGVTFLIWNRPTSNNNVAFDYVSACLSTMTKFVLDAPHTLPSSSA